jgi:hypothetical protein
MIAHRLLAGIALSLGLAVPVTAQTPTPSTANMPAPPPMPGGAATASPTATLTAPPTMDAPVYPPGTVLSPWCGEHGCSGPVGGNGPVTYEILAVNGISLPVGGSELTSNMKAGFTTGGVMRTLWFRPDRESALTFDLGLTWTYNRGQGDKSISVNTPRNAPVTTDVFGNQTGGQRLPDLPALYQLRALSRTNFNFGFGRDWWFRGPADVLTASPGNVCVGAQVNGHWGAGHVDLVPRENPLQYLRKDGVTHGFGLGLHMDYEKPMGNWILTYGLRCDWHYTITNLVPPQGGDIHDVNILFTIGARF